MFPETVGRTLEEVEEIFASGHTFAPWKVGRDVGKRTLGDVRDKAAGDDDKAGGNDEK